MSRCCDGYCGAEDCERCRPGCTARLARIASAEAMAEAIAVGAAVYGGTIIDRDYRPGGWWYEVEDEDGQREWVDEDEALALLAKGAS